MMVSPRNLTRVAVWVALIGGSLATAGAAWAFNSSLTDAQVRQEIISAGRAAYLSTGHPCACPYDYARNGSSCGRRSA